MAAIATATQLGFGVRCDHYIGLRKIGLSNLAVRIREQCYSFSVSASIVEVKYYADLSDPGLFFYVRFVPATHCPSAELLFSTLGAALHAYWRDRQNATAEKRASVEEAYEHARKNCRWALDLYYFGEFEPAAAASLNDCERGETRA